MSWILLFIAGLLEVAWAAGLKSSEGFTRLWPSVFTLVTATGSFVLLAMAMRQLPLGTAYAVWTGIGAVGAFIFGIVMMGEALTVARVASAASRWNRCRTASRKCVRRSIARVISSRSCRC
ncbi:MAG: small multidrug resistance family (SMR) protein [uncultured Paraburkholderia sp.]|nr:MAG: small multidrug resistance family (SMR) protein [uncultured Paraburkholderia sp.]